MLLNFPRARAPAAPPIPCIVPEACRFPGAHGGVLLAAMPQRCAGQGRRHRRRYGLGGGGHGTSRSRRSSISSTYSSGSAANALCPADPSKALANGIHQDRLEEVVSDLVAPGTRVAGPRRQPQRSISWLSKSCVVKRFVLFAEAPGGKGPFRQPEGGAERPTGILHPGDRIEALVVASPPVTHRISDSTIAACSSIRTPSASA